MCVCVCACVWRARACECVLTSFTSSHAESRESTRNKHKFHIRVDEGGILPRDWLSRDSILIKVGSARYGRSGWSILGDTCACRACITDCEVNIRGLNVDFLCVSFVCVPTHTHTRSHTHTLTLTHSHLHTNKNTHTHTDTHIYCILG